MEHAAARGPVGPQRILLTSEIRRPSECQPKHTKAPIRAKRTKTEIQREFDEIGEQSAAARESADPKTEEASRRHETEVRKTVEGVTVESAVQRISRLGIEISKALSGLSGKLTEEVQLLASVREAVELERKEMERLHKIDVAATALDQMVQDYARAEEENWKRRSPPGAPHGKRKPRASERERKEQEESLKKQRQREIEDYEYKKTLERKKAQDKYEEDLRLQEKKNKEKQETLEKGWQQREAALKEREEELTRLRKEAEEFPASGSRKRPKPRRSRRGARPSADSSRKPWCSRRTPKPRSGWPNCR